jgi:type I restriction enzyme S subunit
MKSNYDKLGGYIRQVDERNTSGSEDNLLGVSTQKYFIDSIANTVGTDFRGYKKVKRGQFVYVADTSRRGDKIGIALLTDRDEGIVSSAYTVFEVTDTERLLPEYLMLWFKRPEFDRYARFHSHGSVREIFDWEELGNVELPVPDIQKQKEVVKAYKTIEARIQLKRQINDNLEEQAFTLFRNANISADVCKLGDLMSFSNGKSRPDEVGNIPVYGGNGVLAYTNTTNARNVVVIGRVGAYCGSLYIECGDCWVSDNAISAKSRLSDYEFFDYLLLKTLSLGDKCEGTGQPLLTQNILSQIECPKFDANVIDAITLQVKPLFLQIKNIELELKALLQTQFALLIRLAS